MRVADLLLARRPNFSFEFFPPQDDAGVTALFDTIAALLELDPGFVSVTYGAGGSTRRLTVDLVERIQRELAITPVAHLTCVGSTRAELHAVLGRIVDAGIENVLALRGDPPRGQAAFTPAPDGLAHGSDGVALVSGGYDLCVGAACYPETHLELASARRRLALDQGEGGAGCVVPDHPALLRQPGVLRLRRRRPRRRGDGANHPRDHPDHQRQPAPSIHGFIARLGVEIPAQLMAAFESRRDFPPGGAGAGGRLVHAAMRRAARRRSAGHPLLHHEPLTGDPRHPLGTARGATLGAPGLSSRQAGPSRMCDRGRGCLAGSGSAGLSVAGGGQQRAAHLGR